MSGSVVSRPNTEAVKSAKVGVDEKDTDGISFSMKCPVLASALSAPYDEFVVVMKGFLKKGNDQPEWKGTGFISFAKPIPLTKVQLQCDLASSSCLLHYAAMNSVKHLQYLLSLGMKLFVNFRNSQGNTPLHIVCGRGDVQALHLLLKNGGNILSLNNLKVSCLHSAVTSENLDIVRIVHKLVKTAAIADLEGITPYELALQCHIKNEDVYAESQVKYQLICERLEEMEEEPESVEWTAEDKKGLEELAETELESIGQFKSAMDNTKSICDFQLSETAKSTNAEVLLSVLQSAAKHGQLDAVDWLVKEKKVTVDQVSVHFPVPALLTAAGNGHTGVVQLLVALGANINAHVDRPAPGLPKFVMEAMGETIGTQRYDALHAALSAGHEETALVILSHPGFMLQSTSTNASSAGIEGLINSLSIQETTTKPMAATGITTVKELVTILHPFLRDEQLRTLPSYLKLATQAGLRTVVKALLDRGVEVDHVHSEIEIKVVHMANNQRVAPGLEIIISSDEFTPLASACARGHTDIALLLLETKANANLTLFSYLLDQGIDLIKSQSFTLQLTPEHPIPVHFTFKTNMCTPLILALRFKHTQIVHALVANGANVNVPTLQHNTAAHAGAYNPEVLAYLLANGASLMQCDNNWLTPLAFATKEDCVESVVFLLSQVQPHAFSAEAGNLISLLFKQQLSDQVPTAVKMQAMRAALYVKSDQPGVYHGSVIRAYRVAVANGAPLSAKCLLASMKGKWVCLSAVTTNEKLVQIEQEGKPLYTALDSHCLVARTVSVEFITANINDKHRVFMPLAAYLATEQLITVSQKGQISMVLDMLEYGAMPILTGLQGASYIETFHHLYVTDVAANRVVCKETTDCSVLTNQPYSPLSVALVNANQEVVQILLGCTPDAHKLVKTIDELSIGKRKRDGTSSEYIEQYLPLCEFLPKDRLVKVPAYLHPAAVRMLASRKGAKGFAPLHFAAMDEYPLLTSLLLKAHANINEVDDDGNTPLHTAIRHSTLKTLEVLMFSKANANLANKNGYTAVHVAALFERPSLVKALVTYCGGDLYQPTPDGKSVVELVNAVQTKQDIASYAK